LLLLREATVVTAVMGEFLEILTLLVGTMVALEMLVTRQVRQLLHLVL